MKTIPDHDPDTAIEAIIAAAPEGRQLSHRPRRWGWLCRFRGGKNRDDALVQAVLDGTSLRHRFGRLGWLPLRLAEGAAGRSTSTPYSHRHPHRLSRDPYQVAASQSATGGLGCRTRAIWRSC